jgi:hypothetical protein
MIVEHIDRYERVVLVTGDRKWTHIETVVTALSSFASNTVVVHGYADGADTVAEVVANAMGLRTVRCPAHWRHNDPKCVKVWGECPPDCEELVGHPAGMIRNQKMYDSYYPELILAFHDNIDKSRGTKAMIKYSRKKGTRVLLHKSDGEVTENPDV